MIIYLVYEIHEPDGRPLFALSDPDVAQEWAERHYTVETLELDPQGYGKTLSERTDDGL
jgi:hypothetical protein